MRRMPGMLTVINEECVRQAVRTGLGLNAQINLRSVFDRKNYFYPDSAAGLSDQPVQVAGWSARAWLRSNSKAAIPSPSASSGCIGTDAGKLLHDQSRPVLCRPQPVRVALMEIVSKPDIRDAEQARPYL